ncbi:gluconokinase [Streptomyces cinnabarinus]|uniref:Gluconokinase n=1 Tax=Streptomyces cinnabarinus TaxID=67287 RepID=A0ABY7KLB0_9ACTN|nr:gluconokinase [Streptomyces cinnabarinus]WAZ23887.1 gluconokinase [Streptomyces cinnabarinus]
MPRTTEHRAPCIVVTGVAGTGKTTVARLLAQRMALPFAEGDDFHSPTAIAKMSAGTPLDDADRRPWLDSIGRWLHERDTAGSGGIVTCSALKRRYRDTLRAACPSVFFLHLTATRAQLLDRISKRTGHYMPTSLLDSQLATLEPLALDEHGATLDASPAPRTVADTATRLIPGPAR